MDVVHGIDSLRPEHGRLFVVVGVFDGIHRGHTYLLERLVEAATARGARPAVVTFDHHPDEVLTGAAPPLLLDPAERLERLAAHGVELTVVQHFDAALRQTPYDVFVGRIRERVDLAGFLMTPDAAFGFERRGTPERLGELGAAVGFDVAVVPPYTLDGQPVSSSAIRTAIATGDLAAAERLLGHPLTLRASVTGVDRDGRATLGFPLPVALPPDGTWACRADGVAGWLDVAGGAVHLRPAPDDGVVVISIDARP